MIVCSIKEPILFNITSDCQTDDVFSKILDKEYDVLNEIKKLDKPINTFFLINNKNKNFLCAITKCNSYDKINYQDVWVFLNDLKLFCINNQNDFPLRTITKKFLNDRIKWEKTRTMLRFIFN